MSVIVSDKPVLDLLMPSSWGELSERRLRYVLRLIASERSDEEVRVFCLMRWNNLRILGRLAQGKWLLQAHRSLFAVSAINIAGVLSSLEWLGKIPQSPVRPERMRGRKALPADMLGVPLKVFIMVDNLYQGYLKTQDPSLLRQMTALLYPTPAWLPNLWPFRHWHGVAVFYWWASLKEMFAHRWPDFFRPASVPEGNLMAAPLSPEKGMNAMIRALTKGDVTKEKEILELDTWRAMEELNSQARENFEFQRKYGNK